MLIRVALTGGPPSVVCSGTPRPRWRVTSLCDPYNWLFTTLIIPLEKKREKEEEREVSMRARQETSVVLLCI